MKGKFSSLIIFLTSLSFLLLLSCEGPTGPQGPSGNDGEPGPKLVGKLTGKVLLFDAGVISLDHSGVEIKVEGTNFAAITGPDGKWSIDSLPNSTYNISLSKSGFGEYKYTSFQFTGGGDYFIGTRYLYLKYELPIELSSITLGEDQWGKYVNISGNSSDGFPESWSYFLLLFVGLSDSVSASKGIYELLETRNPFEPGQSFNGGIYYSELNKVRIGIGDTIYLVAYVSLDYVNTFGYFNYEYFRYIDPTSGRYIYTNLGHASDVLSIQLE